MTRPILNLSEVELQPWGKGVAVPGAGEAPDKYQARVGHIAPKLGAKKLGYNLTVIPPGKSAYPFHNHTVNEEMFFVLEGEGTIRIGEERHAIRAGDVVACPPGGRETAHQIVNTSKSDLRVLAVSTKLSPEIAEYPDSDTFGVLGETSDKDGKLQPFRFKAKASDGRPYWKDE